MAVQITLRRLAISVQRRRSWRVSSNLVQYRAFSDRSGSDIVRISDEEVTRKALEAAAREDRLDFETAARLLMSSSQNVRKFGWDFHLVQFFLSCLPSLAVYGVAMYSRSEQRKMEKERDVKIEKLVQAELKIEVAAELEEVTAMLNSKSPELEALIMRLGAVEEIAQRWESAMQQAGNPSQRASDAATKESKPSVPQQEVDRQKPDVAGSDIGGSTTDVKKREGAAEGYWPWFTGKRGAASTDAHEKTQERKEDQQPRSEFTKIQ